MSFILKEVSNVGTANPIVARLSVQFNAIFEFYNITTEMKESAFQILHNDIQKRLLSCYKIATEISNEVDAKITEAKENGLNTQSQGRIIESPHIHNLEERLESYLYNAKSCLRDSLKIYNVFFNSTFTEARFDKAITWSQKEFGDNDRITKFLKTDHDLWIKNIVSMRNAIEHPGGHSGHLHINNIEVNTIPSLSIAEPAWHLNDNPTTLIKNDLHTLVNNILELTEDIVISSLEKLNNPAPFVIIEIPENQRAKESPIRFRMGLPEEVNSIPS